MFYNLSPLQIEKIKQKTYPQELVKGEFVKTVIVNNYASDNSVRILYSFKDGLQNDVLGHQVFKVFNNEQAQKYMRLKIFEILSPEMAKEVNNFKEIANLEKIISKYGAVSRDLTPSLDFNGDKYKIEAHVRLEELNNAIELLYDVTFLIAREKLDYLSIGAVFYYDKEEYIRDQSVDSRFIEPKILVNKLLIYDIFRGNQLANVPNRVPVQDLRLIKSTFKDSGYLRNLLDIISSDKSFNSFVNVKNHLKQNKLASDNDTQQVEYATKTGKTIKIRKSKTKKAPKKMVSNIFYSRNYDKSLGMTFSVDFESLLKENTTYGLLLDNTELKNELLQKCKISSIKILKREVRKSGEKILPQLNTSNILISSGEPADKNVVDDVVTDDAAISEMNLNVGPVKLRSFAVTDKNIFSGHRSKYQYGVEINVSNGITEFLSEYADSLMVYINGLKTYLEETNKIVSSRINDNYQVTVNGSYDPQTNSFTAKFVRDFDNVKKSEVSFKQIVSDAAIGFITTLKLFGLLKEDSERAIQTIIDILHPRATSAEVIDFFIDIYQKLISQIKRAIEINYNNSFTNTYWFENDYVENLIPIIYGYKYMDFDSYRGLGMLKSSDYNRKISRDLNRYSRNPNLDAVDFQNKQYSYVCADKIYSKNKQLSLTDLNHDLNSITNLDYAELEIDIKNINYYGVSVMHDEPQSAANDPKTLSKISTAMRAGALANRLSTNILNSLEPPKETSAIRQNIEKSKNIRINETELMLALAKNFDSTKGVFNKSITVPVDTTTAPLKTLVPDNTPLQVNLLLQDKCLLLKAAENYKKSLQVNSKFQFLFNTLQSVEYLEYNKDTLDEKWVLLTREQFNNLKENSIYLCRMRNYKNAALGVEGLEQIKLPIYEQYFFLNKENMAQLDIINDLGTTIRSAADLVKQKVDTSMLPSVSPDSNAGAAIQTLVDQRSDPFSPTRTNTTTPTIQVNLTPSTPIYSSPIQTRQPVSTTNMNTVSPLTTNKFFGR